MQLFTGTCAESQQGCDNAQVLTDAGGERNSQLFPPAVPGELGTQNCRISLPGPLSTASLSPSYSNKIKTEPTDSIPFVGCEVDSNTKIIPTSEISTISKERAVTSKATTKNCLSITLTRDKPGE